MENIYKDIKCIKDQKDKKIILVESRIDGLLYIKKLSILENYDLLIKIKDLNIKGIPKIYEVEKEGIYTLAIEEYINSLTLDSYLLNKEINETDIIKIMLDLSDALDILHSNNIVHRDIKPDNIFYDGKNVKLFDFDIARKYYTDQDKDTRLLGTPPYAAPEQYGFGGSGPKTDIYALGILFKELLNKITLAEKYSKIIAKATSIDPNDRYSDVKKMSKDILSVYKPKIEQIKKNDLIIKDYRLPGFRGNNTGTKILSAIGYALLIGAVLTSHFSNLKSGSIEEVMMKALYIIGIITFVLLFGNYLGIRRYALLDASKNKALRLIGCFITWLILFLVLIIIFQSFIPKAFLS